MRTLYGRPIRKSTTEEMYPDKMSIYEFKQDVIDNFDAFVENMEQNRFGQEGKYAEEWAEIFLSWSEIEEER